MLQQFRSKLHFRNKGTFVFYMFCFSGSGYYLFSWIHSQKYERPIIEESIRLLQQNQNLVELAGYPLALNVPRGAKALENSHSCDYTFRVRGPKGFANVELKGTAKQQKDIHKAHLESDYYVPSKEIQSKIIKYEMDDNQLKEIKLEENDVFWRIESLVGDIGVHGDYRIEVVNSQKGPVSQSVVVRENLYDLKREMDQRKGLKPQSEEEIEQFRKHREQEMYRKIGSIRSVMIGVTLVLGMASFNYIKRNKRQSVLNSQIHQQALQIIRDDGYVRKRFGSQLKFNQQLRGGRIGAYADFETDVIGNEMGVAQVKGRLNSKSNEWQIDEIVIGVKGKDGVLIDKQKLNI